MFKRNSTVIRFRSYLSGLGVELVEGGQHEHGRLTHARLGLAHDVHAKDGLETTKATELTEGETCQHNRS